MTDRVEIHPDTRSFRSKLSPANASIIVAQASECDNPLMTTPRQSRVSQLCIRRNVRVTARVVGHRSNIVWRGVMSDGELR